MSDWIRRLTSRNQTGGKKYMIKCTAFVCIFPWLGQDYVCKAISKTGCATVSKTQDLCSWVKFSVVRPGRTLLLPLIFQHQNRICKDNKGVGFSGICASPNTALLTSTKNLSRKMESCLTVNNLLFLWRKIKISFSESAVWLETETVSSSLHTNKFKKCWIPCWMVFMASFHLASAQK